MQTSSEKYNIKPTKGENTESQEDDLPNSSIHTATIEIPGAPNEYLHLETSPEELANAFGRFAEVHGVDPEEAEAFFRANVEFTFGTLKNATIPPETPFSDVILYRLSSFFKKTGYFGSVAHSNKGGYELAVNVPTITSYLQKHNKLQLGPLRIHDIDQQTIEEKIAVLKEIINSVTYHEFRHILQFMEEPNLIRSHLRGRGMERKIILAWTTATLAATAVVPDIAMPLATYTGMEAVSGILYSQKDGVRVEQEAMESQNLMSSTGHKRSPYTYWSEKDPTS